jgi:hypothetical protein
MKNHIIIILTLILYHPSIAQAKVEIQIGGANFYGASVNSEYDIPIIKSNDRYLSPSFGIGVLLPSWDGPTAIIHAGLDYTIKKFSLGCEVSNFLPSPFGQRSSRSPDVDLIVYPNLSYTYTTKNSLYFNLSAGAYFAYASKYDYNSGYTQLDFQGDVIPGVGISTGYKF